MQLLQQVLFRHYCQQRSPINPKNHPKYKHKLKRGSQGQTSGLPTYILEKFRTQKPSLSKDPPNKSFFSHETIKSQLFLESSKTTKYKQSLSPLRTQKNLKEYSNLLFVKKNETEPKPTHTDPFHTMHQNNSEQQYTTLSFYHQKPSSKPLKQLEPNSCELQISRLPIICKSNRRKQYLQALQLQHLASTNVSFYQLSQPKSSQIIDKPQQRIQICGWDEGDIFQS